MKLILENWRQYQTLCEKEDRIKAQLLQEVALILEAEEEGEEGGTVSYDKVKEFAKKYGTTPKEIIFLLTSLGIAVGGLGGLAHHSFSQPDQPAGIEQPLPWKDKGRQAGVMGSYSVAEAIEDMADEYEWERAPGTSAVYIPPDQIADGEILPLMGISRVDYHKRLVNQFDTEEGDSERVKEALEKYLWDSVGTWAYGKEKYTYFSRHPETNRNMLPPSWSVAYDLYSSLDD